MQVVPTDQDRRFAAELDDMPRHFGAMPRPQGKLELGSDWRITLAGEEPMARCGASSLAKLLGRYCHLSLQTEAADGSAERCIHVAWTGDHGEGYTIRVTRTNVEIVGDSPAGALYGAHRLQWMMCQNGGPYLDMGSFSVQPGVEVRITSTPFHQPFDDGDDPLTYSDGYLDLMAHYGFNGLHLYIDIYEYMQTPGFEDPQAGKRIDAVAELARRAASYNIGIYLHPNTTRRREDDPVFAAHPELRGAESGQPGSCRYYCYCSSEPLTMRLYADTLNNIIRQAPDVKGIIAIVGGESVLHCYSAPVSREMNGTNCPRCSARGASEVVADWVNAMARPIWEDHPEVHFVVWPYNGWLWSESPEQQEMIALLDNRTGFMACPDKDALMDVDGVKYTIFDYAICYVGPSEPYLVQRDLCRSRDMLFFVKTESSIGLDLLTVPYVPAMNNWRTRWRNLIADKPRGVLANWRFTGLTGTLSEEVAYRETWSAGDEDTLQTIAARLAGDAGREDVIAAWNLFSESFSQLAYCPGLVGLPYFTGPLFLGPAHPLIFTPEEVEKLRPDFTSFDVCFVECERGITLDDIPRVPRFFADSRWAHQIGLPKMLRTLDDICNLWDKGLTRYAKALSSLSHEARPALRQEMDVALMTRVMLQAARNLAAFQLERETLLDPELHFRKARVSRRRLVEIVEEDLGNSRAGLQLCRNNFRFGYGYELARQFDTDLIEAKIDFTERVVLPDIEAWYGSIS